jgi:hypothetical protein
MPDHGMRPVTTDGLPPTQYLIMEVLAARARLGERIWTFPSRLRPALEALEDRALIGMMSGVVENTLRARLTDAGREAVMWGPYTMPALRESQDLLGAISLYIPWRFVTQQLTTPQKEQFADAVDAWSGRLNAGDGAKMDRWWRGDA